MPLLIENEIDTFFIFLMSLAKCTQFNTFLKFFLLTCEYCLYVKMLKPGLGAVHIIFDDVYKYNAMKKKLNQKQSLYICLLFHDPDNQLHNASG